MVAGLVSRAGVLLFSKTVTAERIGLARSAPLVGSRLHLYLFTLDGYEEQVPPYTSWCCWFLAFGHLLSTAECLAQKAGAWSLLQMRRRRRAIPSRNFFTQVG